MRLKRDDEAAVERGARGREHRGDLGRVMAVVVDDQHAAGLAVPLEAALGALEVAQRAGDLLELEAEPLADRHGRQRVLQVVPAGHRQLQHDRALALPAPLCWCTTQRPPNDAQLDVAPRS